MNLEEQIKAKIYNAYISLEGMTPTQRANVDNGLAELEKDVLKLLTPLMAHLQKENRPKDVPEHIKENDNMTTNINEYILKTRKWFEELDNRIKTPSDFVCHKKGECVCLTVKTYNTTSDLLAITRKELFENRRSERKHRKEHVCIKRTYLQDVIDWEGKPLKVEWKEQIKGQKKLARELLGLEKTIRIP